MPSFVVLLRASAALALTPVVWASVVGAAGAGPLANGDFSAGFDAWSGQVVSCTLCDGSDDVTTDLTPPPGAFTNNYATGSGSGAGFATIATSFNSDGLYSTRLWQEFVVDSLSARATRLLLNYSIDVGLSDPTTDLAIAQLSDPDGLIATLDLLNGGPLDITAFAGRTAELYFEVSDFVDGERDWLRVGKLRIDQVPVPAPLLLMGAGLGLLAVRRRQNANQSPLA